MIPRIAIIVGILAFVTGSATVYGISNLNAPFQVNSNQNNPDYSSALNSLNSKVTVLDSKVSSLDIQIGSVETQVSSINESIPDISAIKTSLSDIHTKLADLETIKNNINDIQTKVNGISSNSQVQQVTSLSGTVTISLDKTLYLPGDIIHVTATGADPLKSIQVQLLNNNGSILMNENEGADSSGTVHYDLPLANAFPPGNYQIKVISDNSNGVVPVTISTSTTSSSGSNTFSAQTDKGVYQEGDLIKVSGIAAPSSTVTAVMTSPSAKTITTSTTSNSDGTYTMFFSTSSSFESGSWKITVSNLGQTKDLSIDLQTEGSSNSYAFTAQTDKTSYNLGDTVTVSGTADPSTSVTAEMTSPSDNTYSASTTANSSGSYTISFATSSSFESGSWSVTVTNLSQSKTIYFTLSSSSTFTAQTDKSAYQRGEIVQVSGMAIPGSTVSEIMVSPTGDTYDSSTTTNSDGTYVLLFSTTSSYPTGTWYADVSNQGKSKMLPFTLQ